MVREELKALECSKAPLNMKDEQLARKMEGEGKKDQRFKVL